MQMHLTSKEINNIFNYFQNRQKKKKNPQKPEIKKSQLHSFKVDLGISCIFTQTSSSRKAHRMATSLAPAAPELPSSVLSCLSRTLSAVELDDVSSSGRPLCMTSRPCRCNMSKITLRAVQRTSSTSI